MVGMIYKLLFWRRGIPATAAASVTSLTRDE